MFTYYLNTLFTMVKSKIIKSRELAFRYLTILEFMKAIGIKIKEMDKDSKSFRKEITTMDNLKKANPTVLVYIDGQKESFTKEIG